MVLAAADTAAPRAKDSSSPPPAVTAEAPFARLAGLIAAGGKIIRNKGIASVTRIATGVYCIKPDASTAIDTSKSVAVVSVEYYWSRFNEVVAQWSSQGSGCGSGQFGVITLGDFNLNARYSASNDVGFSIYVP